MHDPIRVRRFHSFIFSSPFSFPFSILRVVPLAVAVSLAACSSQPPIASPPVAASAAALHVDASEVAIGVPDRGEDPAVLALEVDGVRICSASLIAPDVVLTARSCVSESVAAATCPADGPQITAQRPPSSLRLLVGDDAATAVNVAIGQELIVPPGDVLCGADIALLVLDRAIDTIEPLAVRTAAPRPGDHLTAIGYGRRAGSDPSVTKLLREHVPVESTSPFELTVAEASCQGDLGGPTLDETTGEVIGVVARGSAACAGRDAHNVYTRADAFLPLITRALGRSASAGKARKKRDAGVKPPHDTLGGPCVTAADCASGVCAGTHGESYCSRTCDTGDRCPTHYHCTAVPNDDDAGGDAKVCIQQP